MTDQIKILTMVIVAQLSFIPMIIYGNIQMWITSFFIYFIMFGLGVSLYNIITYIHHKLKALSICYSNLI